MVKPCTLVPTVGGDLCLARKCVLVYSCSDLLPHHIDTIEGYCNAFDIIVCTEMVSGGMGEICHKPAPAQRSFNMA